MRTFLVYADKTFKITVPDNAKFTFGPFSPPTKGQSYEASVDRAKGTLRVYLDNKENIIACFTGVRGFRDLSINYAEEVAKEEGAVIWKSDKDGYQREEKVAKATEWAADTALLPAPAKPKRKAK